MWLHEFPLDKEMESDGEWWLPNNPLRRVYGKLKFSTATGLSVELGNSLIPQPNLGPTEPQTVHGEIDHDMPATLFSAVSGFKSLLGPRTPPLTATGLLVGDHVKSIDDQVDQINLRIDGMRDWISEGSFEAMYRDDEPETSRDVQVLFSVKDKANAEFNVQSIPADISFDFEYEQLGAGHSVTLSEDYIASVRFGQPTSIREAITVASDLELLLTLLTGRPAYIQEFGVGPRTAIVSKSKWLIYQRTRHAHRNSLYHRGWMPANYDLISTQLRDVLNQWFSLCSEYRSVLGLLSPSLYRVVSPSSESDFLTMAQAIEAYCRIRSREKYLPTDRFDEIAEMLTKAIPGEIDSRVRNALKVKIGYMNEYSLKDRLRSLIQQRPWLESVISDVEDPARRAADVKRTIREIVGTRNNLTHVDQGRDRGVPMGFVYRLQMMLCLSLLSDIGIDVEQRLAEVSELQPYWWMNIPEF